MEKEKKKKEQKKGLGIKEELSLGNFMRIVRHMKPMWKLMWGLLILAFVIIIIGALFGGSNFMFFVLAAFFAVSIPLAVNMMSEKSRLASIEEHFPDFLRDIAEFKRSGMTLSRAIQNATRHDYGSLSPEVKKIAMELSWGVSFEDAMQKMTDRIESKMIDRAIMIITESQRAGGEVTVILETISGDLRKLKELEKERKSKLSIYTMTIYVIYLLLLGIIVVLTDSLAPAIPKMQAAGEFLGGGASTLTEFQFRELLYHVSLIEAFFAGIISGQMGEGSIVAGIKHAIILVTIALLAFQLVPMPTAVVKISTTIIELPAAPGITTPGLDGITEIPYDFTSSDIAETVREIAKEGGRQRYKNFSPDEVEFLALACTPCSTGAMSISADKVTVTAPIRMRYNVKFSETRYIVAFSDYETVVAAEPAAPAGSVPGVGV